MKTKQLTYYCILSLSIFLFLSCQNARQEEKQKKSTKAWTIEEPFNKLINSPKTDKWQSTNTLSLDKDNNYISSIYKGQMFGIGIDTLFPERFLYKNLAITVESKVEVSDSNFVPSMVVNISRNDSSIHWAGANIINKKSTKKQFTASHTFLIPRTFLLPNSHLKYYFLNTSDKDTLKIYDLKIKVEEAKLKSYLPKIEEVNIEEGEIIFDTPQIKIAHSTSGALQIYNAKDTPLFKNLIYFVEYEKINEKKILKSSMLHSLKNSIENINTKYNIVKENKFSELKEKVKALRDHGHTSQYNHFELDSISGNNIFLSINSDINQFKINININEKNSQIKFTTTSRYKKDICILREALVFQSENEITELYLKNGEKDSQHLEEEYWLSRQGLKIGQDDESCYFLPSANISSFQAQIPNKQIFVNLDYALDHPLILFPLKEKSEDFFLNKSGNYYKKGEESRGQFILQANMNHQFYPRKMRSSDGYLSSYMFSEHADYTDLKLHKAVYLGSSKISKANRATGGFVKHGIPVTKSVFYTNPTKIMNDDKRYKTQFNTPIASIKDTKGFFELLKEIHTAGSEICLHTPDQFTTDRATLIEALNFTQEHFKSTNWIDHGYDNAPERNREDLACDALNTESPFYALDLYKEKGLKYFWATYYENVRPFNGLSLYPFLKRPYYGFGQRFPKPEHWEHPTLAKGIYFWKTTGALDQGNWNNRLSNQVLDDFSNHFSFEINHCYPARIDPRRSFWNYVENSDEIKINPDFDQFLQRLAQYKSKGLINCITVSEALDFLTQCDSVIFDMTKANTFKIINKSERPLKGLSYMCEANAIEASKAISQKKHKEHLIFWFDLEKNEEIIIKLK